MLQFSYSGKLFRSWSRSPASLTPVLQGLHPSVFLSTHMGLPPARFFLNSTHHCLGELRGLLINTYLVLILSVQNVEDMQKALGWWKERMKKMKDFKVMSQSRRTWGSSHVPQYAYIEYSLGYRLSHHFSSMNQSEISNTIHSFIQPLLRLCRASESEDRMCVCDCMNITDHHGLQLLLH